MKRIIYFFFLLLLFSCSNEKEVFEVVKPKDGSPSTIISKTFNLDNHVTKYDNWVTEIK